MTAKKVKHAATGIVIGLLSATAAWAATPPLPGAADPSRIQPSVPLAPLAEDTSPSLPSPGAVPALTAPAGTEKLRFTLNAVTITGSTTFSEEALSSLYSDKLHSEISLADLYAIANALQAKYQEAGYFLTRVSVPDQRIAGGHVTLTVTEGFIEQVILKDPLATNSVVKAYLRRITSEKPLRVQTLESTLLRLNDLPGQNFRAVLSVAPGGAPGTSQLTLIPQPKAATGSIGLDNYGSRFLGPHEASASASFSPIPLQQTTIFGLTSVPTRELGYGSLRHSAVIAPNFTLHAEGGVTRARPGHTLRSTDINSTATTISVGGTYQWERQRDENFATTLTLEGRNVESDIPGAALTREHSRIARANANYYVADAWKGSNVANVTLSQGIDGIGSSNPGDPFLSRSKARPDFTKLLVELSRQQTITNDWTAAVAFAGQIASGTLYSSEGFGYGGQAFGRAFDTSELLGDEGAEGSIELRYEGWRNVQPINLQPYGFYSSGIVTNKDSSQLSEQTASSVGAGVRFANEWNQSGDIGVAIPIGHAPLAPLYDSGKEGPRVMFQFIQNF